MIMKASVNYGLRAVIYLALQEGVCSSREISEQMDIPRDYLIQLALHLRRAGIIKTKPGKNGGYELAKAPADISIGEIIRLFENTEGRKGAAKKRGKVNEKMELVNRIQKFTTQSLNGYLDAITLQDLLSLAGDKADAMEIMASALEQEAQRMRASI